MSVEQRGAPLTEGGIRYTIHPVTGVLITTEVQPPSREHSSIQGLAGPRQRREDKLIIKVSLQYVITGKRFAVAASLFLKYTCGVR